MTSEELAIEYSSFIQDNLFVRACSFNPRDVPTLRKFRASELVMQRSQLPPEIPPGWEVQELEGEQVRVQIKAGADFFTASPALNN